MSKPPTTVIPRAFDANRRPVTREHPRILGSASYLQDLAHQRPDMYNKTVDYARKVKGGNHDSDAKIVGLSLSYVVENNKADGRAAIDFLIRRVISRPIRVGHTTFAMDLANVAVAYDLCHDLWTNDERESLIKYVHATYDANINSERSPFHNGFWGYKNWGIGMAAYALYHDDPRAKEILAGLEHDFLTRGVPCLNMAGDGGGWAEGFYIHYWLDYWLYFCETARRVEGVDYIAAAPDFFKNRATASMFEQYPTLMKNNSRRPIPMGDSHGRVINHVRDQALTARRILVSYFRNDPTHQIIHAYNLQSPGVANEWNHFRDLLYNDTSITAGNLDAFKLSHFSQGPGFVYARSSWKEDATHFFFKSGRRFTSHQHLDNGHFLIFKNQELLGDGGHYNGFDDNHAVNYYCRTIAHNTILIRDPDETWPKQCPETPKGLRAGPPAQNDGGQAFPWSGTTASHNGYAVDVPHWYTNEKLMDIAALPAFKDHGPYVYCAGDFTKSYSDKKAKAVTRQIVFLRPNTFIIFDHVVSTNPAFKKSVLFQAMKPPEKTDTHWVITNPGPSESIPQPTTRPATSQPAIPREPAATQGNVNSAPTPGTVPSHPASKLFIQILEPTQHTVELFQGDDLYRYAKGGAAYPPDWLDNPAPECRLEISPAIAAKSDYFLHVLTVADADTKTVPLASHTFDGSDIVITVGAITTRIALQQNR